MNHKWKLLVVDDDPLIIDSLRLALPDNWSMVGCNSPDKLPLGIFHAAFVDQHLTDPSGDDGLEVIKRLARAHPHLEIIAISGDFNRNLMERCLAAGATRFLAKPLSTNEIQLVLEKIEALHLLHQSARSNPTNLFWFGTSDVSNKLKKQIAMLKNESGPILIEGESGTGKEVIVQLIHQQDGERPLISVNVAAISESLFESELFGHIKGAFTGADQNKMGLAEAAHGGDLFLDEVEALPLSSQVKLLRFLESGEIRRVGAKDTTKVSVRVIIASNQKLEKLVEKGTFREDLLYRLSGKKILLSPLRERANEIPDLINFFLKNIFLKYNKVLSDDALSAMKAYHWPGNIRELKRILEQLCLSCPLPIIRGEDFQAIVQTRFISNGGDGIDLSQGLEKLMSLYETRIIKECMYREKDVDRAAVLLGISRSSLYKKIKDYNIED